MNLNKPFRWIFRLDETQQPNEPFGVSMFALQDKYQSNSLNRTAWKGTPPRSCRIMGSKMGPDTGGKVQIEVEYRPIHWVSFSSDTKYVGWTAFVPNRSSDGVFLDRDGNPLPDGDEPILLQFEVYRDIEFNDLDFGEMIEEIPFENDEEVTFEDVLRKIEASGKFEMGGVKAIAVPHRRRAKSMMQISDEPTGQMSGGFGDTIHNINSQTPHIEQAVAEVLSSLVRGFLEGRNDLTVIKGGDLFMLNLSALLPGSNLPDYLPDGYLQDLARYVSDRYMLTAKVVTGESYGLLLEF